MDFKILDVFYLQSNHPDLKQNIIRTDNAFSIFLFS